MSKQRCKIASKNVNFTYDDNERPYFGGNGTTEEGVKLVKEAWTKLVFANPWLECTYNEVSTLDANINVPYTNLKNVRNTNYVLVEVYGETKYYFVSKVTIRNDSVATLTLRLDTVTTYLDNIKFGHKMLVKRRHFDRFVKDGDKYKINMSEHSGIWNRESDIPSPVLIPSHTEGINVLGDESSNLDSAWWPVAFMRTKTYTGSVYPYTPSLGAGKEFSTSIQAGETDYNSKLGKVNIYSNGWLLSPLNTTYKLFINNNEAVSVNDLNSKFSADIIKIYASPLPPKYVGEIYKTESTAFHPEDDKVYISNLQREYIALNGSKVIYRPSDLELSYLADYNGVITFPSITKHVYTKDELKAGIKDPKILTSNHTRHVISSVNGQTTELVNEYILSDDKLKFELNIAATTEGVIQQCRFNNPYYSGHNASDSKTFTVSYKDQVPANSNAYNDYMLANANSYKTAQSNTRRSARWGMFEGLVGGFTGAASGAASGAKAGPAGAAIGAAMGSINGLMKIGSSFIQGKNRLNELTAQRSDLLNLGSTTELDDVSLIKDIATGRKTGFGDTKLNYTVYTMPDIQQDRVDSYYKKYGYECDNLELVNDYNYFSKRTRYSYFEVADFKSAVDKSTVPVEVLDDLERIFGEGVRLWAFNLNNGGDSGINISDYTDENWEWNLF